MSKMEKLDHSWIHTEFEDLNILCSNIITKKTNKFLQFFQKKTAKCSFGEHEKKHEEFEKSFLESWDEKEGALVGNLICAVLKLMSLTFCFNSDFRRNIENFNAVYVFTDQENSFYVSAHFENSRMRVEDDVQVKNPTLKLVFKDDDSLRKILFGGGDMLNAMLNQDVSFEGNINYLNKFAYMALHLMLTITHKASFAD